MNNTQYTPAPWQIDYSGNCHIGITDENDRTLAFCSLQNEDCAENEANARLIAAAPDLLSALEELCADKYLSDPINADRMKNARAAIAKAKGEK